MMRLHTIKNGNLGAKKALRRARGPGGKRGKTAGRGQKGQLARSRPPRGFEGGQTPLRRRLPRRGFTNIFKTLYWTVNLHRIANCKKLAGKTEITPQDLIAAGLVRNAKRPVKILGGGDALEDLKVQAHGFTQSAIQKIQGVGGSVSILKKTQRPVKRAG